MVGPSYSLRRGSLATLLVLTACNSSTQLSKFDFTKVYYDTMSKRFPSVKFIQLDERTIKSEWQGEEVSHYSDNAYHAYKQEPDSIVPIIQRYTNSDADIYGMDSSLDVQDLVPVIKPVSELEAGKRAVAQAGAKGEFTVLHDDYNNELIICYAIDMNNGIRYLQESDLEKLKVPKDSLQSIAIRNLESRLSIRIEGKDGLFMFVADGNYEASIILMRDLWTKDRLPVDGDFVIALPSRDKLLITGSRNKTGIEKVKEFSKKTYQAGNYSISEALYKWDGKRFSKYEG